MKIIGLIGMLSLTSLTMAVASGDEKYPLTTCVVSGEKLGTMGQPYVFDYEGQTVEFCCSGCKKDFLKDPPAYLKKIQEAEKAS